VNDASGGIWKKTVVVYFNHYTGIFLDKLTTSRVSLRPDFETGTQRMRVIRITAVLTRSVFTFLTLILLDSLVV
jgi:hypothetical protein